MDDWSFVEIARLVERRQASAAAELARESRPFAEGWLAFGGLGAYVNKACCEAWPGVASCSSSSPTCSPGSSPRAMTRAGGEVVGAGGCESRDGLTALFGTSVKPAFRGRGIQQALIAARLERGSERGSRLAVIISGPGIPTERNAARLGFQLAYSRVYLVKHGEGLAPSAPP